MYQKIIDININFGRSRSINSATYGHQHYDHNPKLVCFAVWPQLLQVWPHEYFLAWCTTMYASALNSAGIPSRDLVQHNSPTPRVRLWFKFSSEMTQDVYQKEINLSTCQRAKKERKALDLDKKLMVDQTVRKRNNSECDRRWSEVITFYCVDKMNERERICKRKKLQTYDQIDWRRTDQNQSSL